MCVCVCKYVVAFSCAPFSPPPPYLTCRQPYQTNEIRFFWKQTKKQMAPAFKSLSFQLIFSFFYFNHSFSIDLTVWQSKFSRESQRLAALMRLNPSIILEKNLFCCLFTFFTSNWIQLIFLMVLSLVCVCVLRALPMCLIYRCLCPSSWWLH